MTAPRKICHSSHINLVKYLSSREFGRSFRRAHQIASDLVTSRRALKPLLAETSPNCRSTYLLRLSSANELVAAAHGDRSITIYCAQTGRVLAKCLGHERSPWTLMFHPTQSFVLASGCLGGGVRLWHLDILANVEQVDAHQPRTIHCTRIWRHSGAVASIAFHPTHSILAVACTQEVVFHDWISGQKLSVWRFVSNYSRVRWVKFSPDGNLLYTATANPSVTNSPGSGKLSLVSGNLPSEPVPKDEYDQENPGQLDYLRFPRTVTNPSVIPLDSLLEFLIRKPDAWFRQLGICDVCAVRLCRWAGALLTSTRDIWQGANLAAQVARSVASEFCLAGVPPSHLLQDLLSPSPSTLEHIMSDANPSAVAIIEDMPVHEFLLSRGNYCHKPPTILLDSGLCCGGHACDLVLMHRGLMRHSLCRSCLAAFWKWASPRVTWWHWSNGSAVHSISQHTSSPDIIRSVDENKPPSITQQTANTIGVNTMLSERPSTDPPVGVCVRCQAGVGSLHDPPASSSVDESACMLSTVDLSNCQGTLPLAALELLRSRLSNANEVTAVTYMAPDLINDGLIAGFIQQSLRSPVTLPRIANTPRCVVSLLRRASLTNMGNLSSPQRKRRRMDTTLFSGESATYSKNTFSPSWKFDVAPTSSFPVNNSNIVSNSGFDNPSLHIHGVSSDVHTSLSLSNEAAEFGRLLSNCSDNSWNLPHPARVVAQSTFPTFSPPTLQLFPFVDAGSRLLRPVCRSSSRGWNGNVSDVSGNSEMTSLQCSRGSPSGCSDTDQSDDVDADQSLSVTACCRCGHIVPQTFPVDPHSRLSAAVCENLVLPGIQYNHVNNSSFEKERIRGPHDASQSSTPQSDTSLVHPLTDSFSPPNSPGRRSGIMYLVNRTNADFMLSAIHRSITEVISGLFVDMGEHGSANNLEDTTYRICRWELNFCRPSSSVHSTSTTSCTGFTVNTNEHPFIRPMPANIAVSYNANSLVLPHARLFNDSSICLSPDGRMLAAFVAPSGNQQHEFSHSSTTNDTPYLDTFLAVYRLQPKARRGQCLFYRRFATLTPVCLDFSPLCNYLVVGMATTRLPSATLPPTSLSRLPTLETLPSSVTQHEPSPSSNLLPKRHTCVAQIFHLDRVVESVRAKGRKKVVRRMLSETASIKHPLLLDPVSSSFLVDSQSLYTKSSDSLDRWHRLLLSSSSGVSLNTIVWNPNGGLFYGTTKGLLVIMRTQPNSLLSDRMSAPNTSSFSDLIDQKEHCTTNQSSVHTLHEPLGVMC